MAWDCVSVQQLRSEWLDECSGADRRAMYRFFRQPAFYIEHANDMYEGFNCEWQCWQFIILRAYALELRAELWNQLECNRDLALPAELEFSNISAVDTYTTAEFWRAYKSMTRANAHLAMARQERERAALQHLQELQRQQALPQQQSTQLNRARSLVWQPQVAFIALDFEWWERGSHIFLEFGWSCWDTVTRRQRTRHWIIREHMSYSNGRYVENNRNAFRFGQSIYGTLGDAAEALQDELDEMGLKSGPLSNADARKLARCHDFELVVVGHSVKGDLDKCLELNIDVHYYANHILDTMAMAKEYYGTKNNTSLGKLCTKLGYTPDHLHNAGNDAYWTMRAFLNVANAPMDRPY